MLTTFLFLIIICFILFIFLVFVNVLRTFSTDFAHPTSHTAFNSTFDSRISISMTKLGEWGCGSEKITLRSEQSIACKWCAKMPDDLVQKYRICTRSVVQFRHIHDCSRTNKYSHTEVVLQVHIINFRYQKTFT